MKSPTFQERLAGAAAWAYCVWQSRALAHVWSNSPYDKAGFLAFLIWCLPVLAAVWHRAPMRMGWLAAGVLTSLAGSLGELNLVAYAGLALTTCGFLPPARSSWVQLAGSVSWMNVGWILSSLGAGPDLVNVIRLVIAALTAFLVLRPPAFLR